MRAGEVRCEGCGKNIRNQVRYAVDNLVEATGESANQLLLGAGISGTTMQDARCHGLTLDVADRIVSRLDLHLDLVWPELADDGVDDAPPQPCAGCTQPFSPTHDEDIYCTPLCRELQQCAECGGPFKPVRKGHIYCQPICRRRKLTREWMRKKYQSDPEYRAKRIAERRERYKEEGRYERLRQRRYYYASGEAQRRKERYWSDPEYREMRKQQSRDRRAKLKEAS